MERSAKWRTECCVSMPLCAMGRALAMVQLDYTVQKKIKIPTLDPCRSGSKSRGKRKAKVEEQARKVAEIPKEGEIHFEWREPLVFV